MKSKEQLLPIGSITVDAELYPREKSSWLVAYAYSQAMKAGARFPPIEVAKLDGKLILMDGNHRIEALKINKEKYVNATVFEGLAKKEIFIRAVEMNVRHGLNLSPFDKAKVIRKLQDMKIDVHDISKIVQVPFDKIETFVSKRIVNTLTGEEIIVKAPLKGLVGLEAVEMDPDIVQNSYSGSSSYSLVDQLISILASYPQIVDDDKRMLKKLKNLYETIGKVLESPA